MCTLRQKSGQRLREPHSLSTALTTFFLAQQINVPDCKRNKNATNMANRCRVSLPSRPSQETPNSFHNKRAPSTIISVQLSRKGDGV